MNDESARMIDLARRDLRAAQGMAVDTLSFTDEIFGFHAQQAVEKACKAWLCGLGIVYPKTHDLDLLFHLLSDLADHVIPPGGRMVGGCIPGVVHRRSRTLPPTRSAHDRFRRRVSRAVARALCTQCTQTLVVAFSCKRRGVCPSCNGRHMAQTAAHLVDYVIPPVPVRQWVISLHKRLRGVPGDRPKAVTALDKRECRQAGECREQYARRGRARYRRLLRHTCKTPLPRHPVARLGRDYGAGGGKVSPAVPTLRRRHPA